MGITRRNAFLSSEVLLKWKYELKKTVRILQKSPFRENAYKDENFFHLKKNQFDKAGKYKTK